MKLAFFPGILSGHSFRAFLIAISCGAHSLRAQESSPKTLDQLKFEFQVQRAETKKKSLDEPQAALDAKYQGFLIKLKDDAAAKGNLDQALAVTKAIEDFAKGTVPDGSAADPDLKRAQNIHLTESAAIRAAHARDLRPLVGAYQQRLGDLVVELTKAKQLEAALAARQEGEAMTALLKELATGGGATPTVAAATPATMPTTTKPFFPASTAGPDSKQGKLNAWGKFYGGSPVTVDSAGSANRFVSVFPLKEFGWIALRSNGTVATNTLEEAPHFRGRIAKLGTSELRYTFAGIDTTGRLQAVLQTDGPLTNVPKMDKKVTQYCINAVRNLESFLALLEDGTVKYWGSAYEGANAKLPPAAALTGIRAIAACQILCHALRNDGTVVSWRLGGGEEKVPDHIRDVVEIAAGGDFTLGLTSQGKVLAWGNNNNGQCNVPPDLGRCVTIRASSTVGAAKKENGKWAAWGANPEGLLDKIASLDSASDIAFFGSPNPGYASFLVWIE